MNKYSKIVSLYLFFFRFKVIKQFFLFSGYIHVWSKSLFRVLYLLKYPLYCKSCALQILLKVWCTINKLCRNCLTPLITLCDIVENIPSKRFLTKKIPNKNRIPSPHRRRTAFNAPHHRRDMSKFKYFYVTFIYYLKFFLNKLLILPFW